MNREEQLTFCKKCTNRKMDMQQGIICSLTGAQANFFENCADFNHDTSVKQVINDTEPIANQDLSIKIPDDAFERIRLEQNFPKAVIGGLTAGLLGAILWGIITVATNYQIGYMALAIGAGVGFSIRFFGQGVDQIFGITGAMIAVTSCLLGNFFSIVGYIGNGEGLGYIETILLIDYSILPEIMAETFSPIDLLFYGIAGYEGYKFAFRVFTEKDLVELKSKQY